MEANDTELQTSRGIPHAATSSLITTAGGAGESLDTKWRVTARVRLSEVGRYRNSASLE